MDIKTPDNGRNHVFDLGTVWKDLGTILMDVNEYSFRVQLYAALV